MTTRPAKSSVRPNRPAVGAKPSLKFFREVVSEIKKVTWPSRDEAVNLSTIVIIVSAAVGFFLGTFDWLFSQLVALLVLR